VAGNEQLEASCDRANRQRNDVLPAREIGVERESADHGGYQHTTQSRATRHNGRCRPLDRRWQLTDQCRGRIATTWEVRREQLGRTRRSSDPRA